MSVTMDRHVRIWLVSRAAVRESRSSGDIVSTLIFGRGAASQALTTSTKVVVTQRKRAVLEEGYLGLARKNRNDR
jgi:hypothetical protein